MENQKFKNIGKIIIVILAVAICFFLLLPFLEPDSADGKQAQAAKKASPQIFTSNPLSELVRKVYAMFSRDQRRKERARLAAAQAQQAAQPLAQQDSVHAEQATENKENTAQAAASYDRYGNAEFVNEDGEWILVRQTAPEAAQRGMHDISSKENAYDKYVHLDRAAKYTPPATPAQPEIPDSKWARVWQPIKNFFTGSTPKSQHLAKADAPHATALGTSAAASKATDVSLPGVQVSSDNFRVADLINGNDDSSFNPIFLILDPEGRIVDIATRLKETAHKVLTGQDADKATQAIDKEKQSLIAYAKEHFKQQMEQDAQKAQPIEVQKALENLCEASQATSFYTIEDQPLCSAKHQQRQDVAEQDIQAAQAAGRQELRQFFIENFQIDPGTTQPVDMLVIFGKTDPQPLEEIDMDDPDNIPSEVLMKYRYLYKQKGCEEQPCYWVGRSEREDDEHVHTMKQTVDSSGLAYLGDPNNILAPLAEQYAQQNSSSSNEENGEESAENTQKTDQTWPYWVPYNLRDIEQLNQRNTPGRDKQGHPTRPESPFVVFVPSAANANKMLEALPMLPVVIYDNPQAGEPEQILSQQNQANSLERGRQLRRRVEDRLEDGHNVLQQAGEQMQDTGTSQILQHALNRLRDELSQSNQQGK